MPEWDHPEENPPEGNPSGKDLTGEDGGTIVELVERSAALPINRTGGLCADRDGATTRR